MPFDVPGDVVVADWRSVNALRAVVGLMSQHKLGLKTGFNTSARTYDIGFIRPVESEAMFSKEFANVVEQDYFDDIEGYRNVVLMSDGFVHNNALHTGFNRREMFVNPPTTAVEALRESGMRRGLTSVINTHGGQFEYLRHWDLGSVVYSQNRELGYSEREVVAEVTEYFDEAGRNVEVKMML